MTLKIACAALLLVMPTLAHAQQQDAVYDFLYSEYRPGYTHEVADALANCVASWMTDDESNAFMVPPVGGSGLANMTNLTSAMACQSSER